MTSLAIAFAFDLNAAFLAETLKENRYGAVQSFESLLPALRHLQPNLATNEVGLILHATSSHFSLASLPYLRNHAIPVYERGWLLRYVLPGLIAYAFTNDFRIDEEAQEDDLVIKDMVTETIELKPPVHPDVTTFYLGREFLYQQRNFPFHTYRVDPHPGGIFAAHKHLASICPTRCFGVVDEDSTITEFPEHLPKLLRHSYVYYAANPYVPGLVYGHGGFKIFQRSSFLHFDSVGVDQDMTETVTKSLGLEVIAQTISSHQFGTDSFSLWRGAFREGYKLLTKTRTSKGFDKRDAQHRLEQWSSSSNPVVIHALYTVRDLTEPFPINDEQSLRNLYSRTFGGTEPC